MVLSISLHINFVIVGTVNFELPWMLWYAALCMWYLEDMMQWKGKSFEESIGFLAGSGNSTSPTNPIFSTAAAAAAGFLTQFS
jgi:hypothetical protein